MPHEPMNDHRGPMPRNKKLCSPPALGIAAVSSAYVRPTTAMITPPAAIASTAPSVPAEPIQSPVSTTQPKPIIAPNPSANTSQLPRTFSREVSSVLSTGFFSIENTPSGPRPGYRQGLNSS